LHAEAHISEILNSDEEEIENDQIKTSITTEKATFKQSNETISGDIWSNVDFWSKSNHQIKSNLQ
jgi:hypothetical protein